MTELDPEPLRLLEDLVLLRQPIGQTVDGLRPFAWDCDVECVILSRPDVSRVLDRFLAGGFHARDSARGANAVECREDIGFEVGHEADLKEFVFGAANPELNGPMTVDEAVRRKEVLQS